MSHYAYQYETANRALGACIDDLRDLFDGTETVHHSNHDERKARVALIEACLEVAEMIQEARLLYGVEGASVESLIEAVSEEGR